ncbi:myosin-IIIb-like [Dendropsophus ebraccatus]|uniref:myosin-IIIb-like n=1 Tax=Dendropsophus ebraccatus TaxID=150705 RepID=UPI00383198B0
MEALPEILSPLPGGDAAALPELTEEKLLETLHGRYRELRVYTYIGDILVAVNPLQPLPLYGPEVSDVYSSRPLRLLPPHIFAVADRAYNALQSNSPLPSSGSQCIVISGDSGAGKTESTKLLLRHVVRRSRGSSQLCQQILQVNPLLEAFGNAETVMNQNSSRFGKYIQLRFSDGSVRGAKINEYLLEKSRVSHQDPGERNFHVFYYMLFGCPEEEKEVFGLLQPSMYRYIGQGWEESDIRRWSDGYQTLCNAMRMVGFHNQEELDLQTILSGVLSLGNLVFEPEEAGGVSVARASMGWLKAAAGQFGVQPEDLMSCLICTISVTRGEAIRRLHSKQQAEDARDSISRVVYSRLFGWIVTKVNELLAGDVVSRGGVQEIGILDIFGFENFVVNRFEQLCINLANEQLQNFFNQHIFLMELQHYREEGIQEDAIAFTNNQSVLDLFLARPWGILSILDEQTSFPQASDSSFVEKLSAGCRGNANYERLRGKEPGFTVHHYAGKVQYTAVGFLEKNRDTIPMNIQNLFISSETLLLSLLFTASISRTGTLMPVHREKALILQDKASARKMSVGAQFRKSLAVLMEKMYAASPHFIRCIKPNKEKLPGVFRPDEVLNQLRYNGLMETMRIRRDGFSWRPTFQDFFGQFGILLLTPNVPVSRESCIEILQGAQLSGWQCGTSRLFFKYWHQDEMRQKLLRLQEAAITIQKCYKGFLCRRAFLTLMDEMRKLKEKLRQEEEEAERERARQREEEAERERVRQREEEAERERARQLEEEAEQERMRQQKEEAEQERARQRQEEAKSARQQEEEAERERARQQEKEASKRAAPRPVPLPRRRPHPTKQAMTAAPADPPIPRPRSRLFQLSPFDNPLVRPRVPSICPEDGDKKLMQRRKTLLWFKETQAKKVLDGGVFPPWLHGMISRRDAENLLFDKEPGDFLIRISQTRAGYILTYRARTPCCRHYMVDVRCNGCYVILGEDRAHTSLMSLVEFHQSTGIQPYGEILREPCGKPDTWEPDYEELKFLKRTLSLSDENVASPPSLSSGVSRSVESLLLHRKSIRRAMHEIQQASPVQMTNGCKAEEPRASSVR